MMDDEDLRPIKLPNWRYDEITASVLEMFKKVDARMMPLPVFDIANRLGYSLVPYLAYGPYYNEVFMSVSKDGLTIQLNCSHRPIILYNDHQISTRVNFSIMHEIAHNELDHREQSELAEHEANFFAGVALCPIALLIHYGITDAQTVSSLFNVSDEFARNRLRAANNRRGSGYLNLDNRIDRAFIERFRFKATIQLELFNKHDKVAMAQ